MANSTYTSSPVSGVGFDVRTTDPLVRVGTVVPILSDNKNFQAKFAIYVKANGAIAANNYVTVDLTTTACYGSSVDGGAGTAYCRAGSVAFADGEFGWVAIMRTAIFQT